MRSKAKTPISITQWSHWLAINKIKHVSESIFEILVNLVFFNAVTFCEANSLLILYSIVS